MKIHIKKGDNEYTIELKGKFILAIGSMIATLIVAI
jgi:hypothetical protein